MIAHTNKLSISKQDNFNKLVYTYQFEYVLQYRTSLMLQLSF